MANKFTKSVLDRLEQEAQRQKDTTKSSIDQNKSRQTEELSNKKIIEENISEVIPKKENQKPLKKETESALPDLSSYIRPTQQRIAKNKTFYLDQDVIEAIKLLAQQQKTTESRLVNDILRRIFLLP